MRPSLLYIACWLPTFSLTRAYYRGGPIWGNNFGIPGQNASYDYVVVGGGTAGLTVASRLSEDEHVQVLVIEAGGDHANDPLVTTPGLLTAQYGNDEYDWNFLSTPQVRMPTS